MGTIPTPFRKTDHEEPQREVVLDAFYIGKLPLTNAQYSQFLAEKGGYPPHFHDNPRFNPSDCPIVGVSWYDALAFLDVAQRTYRQVLPPADGGRVGESRPWNGWTHLSLGK